MMITLRVVAILSRPPTVSDARRGPGDPASPTGDDAFQLGQVADLVAGRRHAGGERLAAGVDPGHVHADAEGADHVDVGPIPDEERATTLGARAAQRLFEDVGAGL